MTTSSTPATTADLPRQRTTLVQELAAGVRGEVALPGSDAYLRLCAGFNLAAQPRPAAVVAAADAYDVAAAVRTAGRHGVRVGVQCTGHGASASMDGALLVHTGDLAECVVHPEGWARVGAGVRWRAVVDAAAEHGFTPLAGSSSGVGVVGYTTGGGLGPMARTFGVASDLVRAFDVVTGDGRLVRTTASEHPDLFWGLRGGRGSLGIVTAVEFDLVPLRTVYAGALHFDAADAARVLPGWERWTQTLPESVTTSLAIQQLPPLPHVPAPLAGRMTLAVRVVVVGDAEEAERLLAPLREVAGPVLDRMGVLPCTALDAVHGDPVGPLPAQSAGLLLRELPRGAVQALLAVAGPDAGSPLAGVELRHLGGAVARPPGVPSAVAHREAPFGVHCVGLAAPEVAEAVAARMSIVLTALAPWSSGATSPNFGGGVRAYDAPTLARLRALVQQHDPERVLLGADELFPDQP